MVAGSIDFCDAKIGSLDYFGLNYGIIDIGQHSVFDQSVDIVLNQTLHIVFRSTHFICTIDRRLNYRLVNIHAGAILNDIRTKSI